MGEQEDCGQCEGKGLLEQPVSSQELFRQCPACEGRGRLYSAEQGYLRCDDPQAPLALEQAQVLDMTLMLLDVEGETIDAGRVQQFVEGGFLLDGCGPYQLAHGFMLRLLDGALPIQGIVWSLEGGAGPDPMTLLGVYQTRAAAEREMRELSQDESSAWYDSLAVRPQVVRA